MDWADDVDKTNEIYLKAALEKRKAELVYTGRCYNCDELLPPEQKFCDADCRDDYEARKRNMK